eukprot:CAMPEP_0167795442 /NCGR_PEP_ID=MMETSP0111_2-20121227/14444_1 /TAXON_ID=91324 /ORGANISM="Lotharella globosa, Strain CCCM811" /LENGTH=60 /DNA_ID=CAMNT_0007689123 /DNA_START=641 /DNA_END=823 /DNA_ORIENTATION=+
MSLSHEVDDAQLRDVSIDCIVVRDEVHEILVSDLMSGLLSLVFGLIQLMCLLLLLLLLGL